MADHKEYEALLERLYMENFEMLYRYALNLLDDKSFAEDAVQETFRIACGKPETLMNSRNTVGWLVITLRNVARNIRRWKYKMQKDIISVLFNDEKDTADKGPENDVKIMYSDILSDEDFKLIKMIVLDKCTIREAAEEIGISEEACKKRIQRAKKKMKERLENHEEKI